MCVGMPFVGVVVVVVIVKAGTIGNFI